MDERLSLAIKYYQSNVDDQAQALVDEVLAEPNPPQDAISFAATLAFERRDLAAAIAYCDSLLQLTPDDGHTLLLKGRALSDLNQQDAALACLEHAVRAEPGLAAAHYNLAWIYQRTGQIPRAIDAYRAAIALQDPYPVAWNNLGLALERSGDWAGAIAAFQTAVKQFPEFSPAHNNLGAALAASGRFKEAVHAYREALEVDPRNLDALTNMGVALLEQGAVDAAIISFQEALEVDPSHTAALDNRLYAEVYRRDDAAALRLQSAKTGADWKPQFSPDALMEDTDGHRPLRVGFLSPDFRRHSVSFFALPLIRNLNPAQFKPILFSNTAQTDAVTDQYKTAAAEWMDVHGRADDDVATIMRAARLDVLVDLAGRTTGNRLPVVASRVAPVQIMAIGYPGPTGIAAMDYWLCDSVTNPVGQGGDAAHDHPLRMERGLHVFAPPADAPSVSQLPAMTEGCVTFGSFNKLAKISEQTVSLWSAVLSAMPESRLVLKARALTESETAQDVKARFAAKGIEDDRIECRGWAVNDHDHLDLYRHIDIALDTFPYNGTTTTCEALWMGVPVLTLSGNSHASRVGASLLTSAGLTDWVADSEEQFVACAAAKAKNVEGLSDFRASLRAQLADSALCDAPATARAFEKAVRQAWQALYDQAAK